MKQQQREQEQQLARAAKDRNIATATFTLAIITTP